VRVDRRGSFTAAGSTVGAAEISNAERGGKGVESGGDYRAVNPNPQSLTRFGSPFMSGSVPTKPTPSTATTPSCG